MELPCCVGSILSAEREDNGSVTTALTLTFPWEEDEPVAATPPAHLSRIVADSNDRVAWIRARSRGVTATDAARLTTRKSVENTAYDKINGNNFGGNVYTDHGRVREPVLAGWVRRHYGIEPSTTLFHAHGRPLHLATPDGIAVNPSTGDTELAEIKTTNKAWRSIPRHYLRQVWWQQYVLGAERTLVVWEQHSAFVPVAPDPECRWVDRDDNEIEQLVRLADQLLDLMQRR
ncbi:recombinase [Subtercola boreus]|uniref:Recombinase n=1 Tax=Subtercola boreus TaxID=120213 RepID=A0A3E0W2M2_9MICO|nr:recombinase [Subtercola boreus]